MASECNVTVMLSAIRCSISKRNSGRQYVVTTGGTQTVAAITTGTATATATTTGAATTRQEQQKQNQ